MITPTTEAWSRFEKLSIESYKQGEAGGMYRAYSGGWIWWADFMIFIEKNYDEEEYY